MVLRYWIRPGSSTGRNSGVDLDFAQGSALRDSWAVQSDGNPSHPGAARGVLGEWTMIEVPLGAQAGRIINRILFAFDLDGIAEPVSSAVDDIEIGNIDALI
jgi:hypothetical protein